MLILKHLIMKVINYHQRDVYRSIVQNGFQLLEAHRAYSQTIIQKKMLALGFEVSKSTLNNIIHAKRATGHGKLRVAGKAIQQIVQTELGFSFDYDQMTFNEDTSIQDWTPSVIPLPDQSKTRLDDFVFHEKGRLSIPDKVDFFRPAQKQVIELGLRLRAFTDYFRSRSAHEFRNHIEELLEKGVTLKLFFIDPTSNEAHLYFKDRANAFPEDAHSCEIIKESIRVLKQINAEWEAKRYPGKLELYKYKHIPHCHYLIVDGEGPQAKLIVSPYLYGTRRADSPLIQVSKRANRQLYRLYWNSFLALTQNAKPILL